MQSLVDLLRHRRVLLVLDNFEHLLDAAPDLAEILSECPGVTFVVTSRAALSLRWEHVLPVPPLAVPDLRHLPPVPSLARLPSVALFVNRGRAVNHAFALTPEQAPAVAELCVRLDGLPLAIELAARQVTAQSPAAILDRLRGVVGGPAELGAEWPALLQGLGDGPRDLPRRQQTLEAAIGWSYGLLAADEQRMFRALAVFEGGFTADAAEAVCTGAARDAAYITEAEVAAAPRVTDRPFREQLDRLVAQSLVVRDGPAGPGQPRYRLLQTIRQYCADRLAESGETAPARDDHWAWCLGLAETGYQRLRTGRAPEWRPRLDAEYENFRAALAWSEEHQERASFARLVSALWWFWHLCGLTGETHPLLARALGMETGPSAVRAHLLNGATVFAYDRGEYGAAETLAAEARSLCQAQGDRWGAALAQTSLGFVAYFRGEYDRADDLLGEGLMLARAAGDTVTAARALNNLGTVALARGSLERAQTLFEEALALWRQLQSAGATALTLLFLGQVAHRQGDQQRATALLEESVALARQSGYARAAGPALYWLGQVVRTLGQQARATALFQESLTVRREQGDRRGIAECLEALATADGAGRSSADGARLLGAADVLRVQIGAALPPRDASAHAQVVAGLRRRLGARYDDLHAAGAALTVDEALRIALRGEAVEPPAPRRQGSDRSSTVAGAAHPSLSQLSPRERQVSALVARGLSNREIANALIVTEGSAANYVQRILTKLGFRSRAQIAAWAARHGPSDDPGGGPA